MQRLFSTFPDGGPGIGLLLLRASAGGLAAATGALCLSSNLDRVPALWATCIGLCLTGTALLVGFMTPYASLLLGLCLLG